MDYTNINDSNICENCGMPKGTVGRLCESCEDLKVARQSARHDPTMHYNPEISAD